ncbi:hypothetical protein JX265_003345 [Neoarthrinium moseri]|uniref:Uncharacterized protein n=1 Tax=Neoarthrinium moseri TaxID=1658444 RepID=A0A9Q0AP71_9PEZI|nr:hypothetical protein JX266_004351 [Neoarthrinium moseri]KAI1877337.1 hypothetical protein JX265_003345 [Neoarthrinium moseri]
MTPHSPRLHNEVYPFIAPSKFRNSLENKITLITGSVGTIGQALSLCFAVAGARLVLVYNRTEPPASFLSKCQELGASSVTSLKCDVSELEGCESLLNEVNRTIGKVDILVNNAGVDSLGPFHAHDPKNFLRAMSVNLHGPYFLSRLLLPDFMERRSGCIINIASRAGSSDMPFNGHYSISKAAMIRMTGCMQAELSLAGFDDIHIYALHPGAIPSNMASAGKHNGPRISQKGETADQRSESAREALRDFPELQQVMIGALDHFKDSPYLTGMASVALATGIAKNILRGKYFDVEQDLEDVISQASEFEADPELYTLHTKFLGGLPNDGGTELRPAEDPVSFPGF